MNLVVVRHGQTDWNVEERYQGQLDLPLNAVGRTQAEALKRRLAGTQFDTAYSSPLRRAFETAQIIAGELPLIADTRLSEIHHGDWQGKTKADIEERWLLHLTSHTGRPGPRYPSPGGLRRHPEC